MSLIDGRPKADHLRPANGRERLLAGLLAFAAGLVALAVSARHGALLLLGDAVDHLGIARQLVDAYAPSPILWGNLWLPLPHVLMLPFVGKLSWWQSGMAGAWPSLLCYVLSVVGVYGLARRLMPGRWALVSAAFFGLNANLLYLSTTGMTEPLCLATVVWLVLATCDLMESVENNEIARVKRGLLTVGALILAAAMTRYDGWIVGAAVWCLITWQIGRRRAWRNRVAAAYLAFTLLAVSGPLAWFAYNHFVWHDWLSFMRGPYSAKEILKRTLPQHYRGWHDLPAALIVYARTAQVNASAWKTGWLVAAVALIGAWKAWVGRVEVWALLLWLPFRFTFTRSRMVRFPSSFRGVIRTPYLTHGMGSRCCRLWRSLWRMRHTGSPGY